MFYNILFLTNDGVWRVANRVHESDYDLVMSLIRKVSKEFWADQVPGWLL